MSTDTTNIIDKYLKKYPIPTTAFVLVLLLAPYAQMINSQLVFDKETVRLNDQYRQDIEMIDQKYQKENTFEIINDKYLTGCIDPILSETSRYGLRLEEKTSEVIRGFILYTHYNDPSLFTNEINKLNKDEIIKSLIYGNSTNSYIHLPHLRHFGYELHRSVKIHLNLCQLLAFELSTIDPDPTAIVDDEIFYGVLDIIRITAQFSTRYLEQRLLELENYIIGQNYETFEEFNRIREDEKLIAYNVELAEYNELILEFMNTPLEFRAETFIKVQSWINEKVRTNPLN